MTAGYLSLIFFALFALWIFVRYVCFKNFEKNCAYYLRRAGKQEKLVDIGRDLTIVLQYLKRENLTRGHTSLLRKTPHEDLGIWHRNIQTQRGIINSLAASIMNPYEEARRVKEIKEALFQKKDDMTIPKIPGGISIFPYNRLSFLLGFCFLGAAIYCAIIFLKSL